MSQSISTAIWDPKNLTENVRLDDGTSDIDSMDAFEYCFTLEGTDIEAFPEGTQIDCTDNDDILKIDTFIGASCLD